MKKLRITVNNRVYDVTVEVLEDDERIASEGYLSPLPPMAGLAATPTPVAHPAAAARAPAPASATRPDGTAIKADPNAILAPIAGTVQKVFAQAGAHVEAKAPVMMLDAMKMDTYIYAPRSGEIETVCAAPGQSVQVGDCLVRYKPEG